MIFVAWAHRQLTIYFFYPTCQASVATLPRSRRKFLWSISVPSGVVRVTMSCGELCSRVTDRCSPKQKRIAFYVCMGTWSLFTIVRGPRLLVAAIRYSPLTQLFYLQIAASCLMAGAYRSVNLSWVDCYYGGASSSGSNVRALLSAVQLAGSQWSHVHTSLLLQGFTQDGVMSRSCQDLSNVCVRKVCVRVWLCFCSLHDHERSTSAATT